MTLKANVQILRIPTVQPSNREKTLIITHARSSATKHHHRKPSRSPSLDAPSDTLNQHRPSRDSAHVPPLIPVAPQSEASHEPPSAATPPPQDNKRTRTLDSLSSLPTMEVPELHSAHTLSAPHPAHTLPAHLGERRQQLFAPTEPLQLDVHEFEQLRPFVSNVWRPSMFRKAAGQTVMYCYCRCSSDTRKREQSRGIRKRKYFDRGCGGSMRVVYHEDGRMVTVWPGKPHEQHNLEYMDTRGLNDALRLIISQLFDHLQGNITKVVERLREEDFAAAGGRFVTRDRVRSVRTRVSGPTGGGRWKNGASVPGPPPQAPWAIPRAEPLATYRSGSAPP